jgi:hypothetical protein
MATIVIKDLPENMDLDREAMQAITGGARLRASPAVSVRAPRFPEPSRDAGAGRPETRRRPAMSTLFK